LVLHTSDTGRPNRFSGGEVVVVTKLSFIGAFPGRQVRLVDHPLQDR
jgi:hypothetical protein